jgi:hypothetical protein
MLEVLYKLRYSLRGRLFPYSIDHLGWSSRDLGTCRLSLNISLAENLGPSNSRVETPWSSQVQRISTAIQSGEPGLLL